MKPALRRLLLCTLVLVVGIGAQAQGDEVLERYNLALANLSESLNFLGSDSSASRDELDRAAGALRFLAAEAGSPKLIEAMERVFVRARTAIQNRSHTDLAVQNSLLSGGFQRALFDSALAVMESEPQIALARLDRLATDLALDDGSRAALQEAAGVANLRRAFEAGVAERVRQQLEQAGQLYPQSKDAAYRALADAYGDFLLIQDSPRADSRLNGTFATTAQELVAERSEQFNAELEALAQSFGRLADAARAADEATVEGGPGADPAPSDEAAVESQAPANEAGNEAAEAPGSTAAGPEPTTDQNDLQSVGAREDADPSTPMADMPAVQGSESVAVTAPAGQVEAAPALGTVGATQQPTGEVATEQPAENVADEPSEAELQRRALARELVLVGVPAGQVEGLAAELQGRGVTSLSELTSNLFASSGRVMAALQTGDASAARDRLADLSRQYRETARPLVKLLSPAVDGRVMRLVERLSATPVLRAEDGLVLIGQVDALDRLLAGRPVVQAQRVNSETAIIWSGWLRLAILLALTLLAVLPLYLLNLAFGGGNRNWQLIGIALFLLMLPVMYEGLASLAALVAELADLPLLAYAATFSMFESPIGKAAWAILTMGAILFASLGLYGICVQFGLLGGKRTRTGESRTIIAPAAAGNADTVVDWDEEF